MCRRWPVAALLLVLVALVTLTLRVDDRDPREDAARVELPPRGAVTPVRATGPMTACTIGPTMSASLPDRPCSRWVLASPAVPRSSLASEESLYLTNGAGFVEARHAPDGAQHWGTVLGGSTQVRAATTSTLYVSIADREIVALEASTGAVRWRHVLAPGLTPLPGTAETIRAVLAVGGSVYVLGGATLFALDEADGATRWRWSDQHVLSAGTTAAGPYAVVSDGVVGLDPLRGTERWRLPLVTITNRPHRADLAMIVVGDATSLVVALDVLSGAVVWSFDTAPGPPVTLEVTANTVVVEGQRGRLWGLDRSEGWTRWSWAPPSQAPVHLLGTTRGVVLVRVADSATLAALDVESGSPRWEREFGRLDAVSALDDELLVADGSELVAVGLRDGLVRWRHRFPAPVTFVAGDPEAAPALLRVGHEVIALQPPR
ncbi:MAG: PQQ-binding-like beta-propeller repeat protein [Nitriliruptorales bacterium]